MLVGPTHDSVGPAADPALVRKACGRSIAYQLEIDDRGGGVLLALVLQRKNMAAVHRNFREGSSPPMPIDDSITDRLNRTPVSSIMTKSVICVTPIWTVEELLSVLVDGNMSGLPVVDDRWRAIGIVSKSDVVRYLSEHGTMAGATVADCMLSMAMTVNPDMPIARVAALMAWEGIHRLPVCGPAGDVIGIVSTLDITRWVARLAGTAQ
jgi:CBS domain-containing protein